MNRTPKLVVIVTPAEVEVNTPVTIDPTATSDPDGQIVAWGVEGVEWAPLQPVRLAFDRPGTYALRVYARDNGGKRVSILKTVTVTPGPPPPPLDPPTITEHPKSQTVVPGQVVELRVSATGTAPLACQWHRADGSLIEGATAFAYAVVPASTSGYFARVSNSAGSADSQVATITVQIVPPLADGVIPSTWIKYRGCAKVPASWHMAYAYGGCSLITVNGEKRLLAMGSEAEARSPIYECALPTTWGASPASAPYAEARRQWLTPYNGKRGAFLADGTFYEFPMNLAINSSIAYMSHKGLAYVTYDETYGVSGGINGIPNPNVLALRLKDDGTTDVYGPFRLSGVDGRNVALAGARWAQLLAQAPDGTMIGASGWSSGNEAFSWGMSLASGADWPDENTPAGLGLSHALPERLLRYYCMLGLIDAQTGVAPGNGPIKSYRKRAGWRHGFERFDGAPPDEFMPDGVPPDPALWVNPAHYGYTSWSECDSTQGVAWVPNVGGKGAVLFSGAMVPEGHHTWYQNMYKLTCPSHGVPPPTNEHGQPLNVTGPCATRLDPYLAAYDPEKLAQVKSGALVDWTVEPEWVLNLSDLGVVIAHAGLPAGGGFSGIAWDAADPTKFYCISHRAQAPAVWSALVHAFEIVPE
jgi:hypothetical protein